MSNANRQICPTVTDRAAFHKLPMTALQLIAPLVMTISQHFEFFVVLSMLGIYEYDIELPIEQQRAFNLSRDALWRCAFIYQQFRGMFP